METRDEDDAVTVTVRIVAEHRGAYHASGDGGVAWCELTGRAFHAAADKRQLPTVGDWVLVERWAEALAGAGAATIRAILPRRGLLVRRAAGVATAPQPLAANVDIGLVLASANGDLSVPRLDRYLAILRDGGIPAVIALSKLDLLATAAELDALLAALAPLATRVIPLSTVSGAGLAEVRACVGCGRTAVLLGSSGVGKSSLLNAMLGDDLQQVRPIRDDDRGRHTTTRRELFAAHDGSLWIDTPGMRELAQWIDERDAGNERDAPDAFDDIAAAAAACRFRDCQHRAEPGCAVRDALPAARVASYHKLLAERATGAVKQHAAARLAETRRAKAKKYPKDPRPT
jgi:ribosome biogenesis GTPase